MKVTQLVGDYGHLHWAYAYYEPNQVDRDTRVDLEKAASQPPQVATIRPSLWRPSAPADPSP
jgi:hypothetical protein